MKKKRLAAIAGILLLSFALVIGAGVFDESAPAEAASTMDEYEAEIKAIEAEMKALKAEISATTAERSALTREIAELDLQLEELERKQTSAANHITVVEYDIDVTANNIADTEARLAQRREVFKQRLYSIYTTGDISLLDVLFASSSFKEFITNYDMLEKVLAQDSELLASIKQDIENLNIEKANLELQKADWESLNNDLLGNIAEVDKIKAAQEEKRKKLSNDIAAMGAEMDDLEADSNALQKELEELQRRSRVVYEGVFTWPLPYKYTTITSQYAMRMHPVKKIYSMHTGIDISAPKNTEIYAASSGEVILSKYYGSYGECVVIDHGDSISTLYGHMTKRAVKVGDKITRGQVIGYVGTTGSSTGYHLHFEVRKNGAHTSPWDYVKKP